jgi:hypothetical protein
MKERHASENKKTVQIKVSAELKELIDKERKLTGETISQIIERAVANLQSSDQRKSPYNAKLILAIGTPTRNFGEAGILGIGHLQSTRKLVVHWNTNFQIKDPTSDGI